ncbi:MAG: GNAT family N-acetyltransferase [Desulfobacteraceae bacterium]|jgi:ribosomal protein S18 acetylase RimI-like enzyme
MKAEYSVLSDYRSWISLAGEVEYLFGPMTEEKTFQMALKQAVEDKNALCIRVNDKKGEEVLAGGVIVSKDLNEILWFAVSEEYRSMGYGKSLLSSALNHLDKDRDIFVQTFDDSVKEGKGARILYTGFGFFDFKKAGNNPAGFPTVIMKLPAGGCQNI